MNEKSPLPKFLTPFFWEYGDQSLSWASDRELIIRRILRNGNWRAVRWLWKQMGDEGLRKWIYNHQGADLSPRQLRFWEVQLELNRQQVNERIARKVDSIWEKRLNS